MTEYTKGPWFVDAEMTEHCCHRSAVCAKVPDGEGMYGNGVAIVAEIWVSENYEANARLISAAPDMLEALPDLSCVINWLENGCDVSEAAKELRIYKARIDAAIAKAKGQ